MVSQMAINFSISGLGQAWIPSQANMRYCRIAGFIGARCHILQQPRVDCGRRGTFEAFNNEGKVVVLVSSLLPVSKFLR